ncbi:hypothetical protein ABIA33_006629 [Streptacidiphilus sp. MAP12-16]|uniref:hypothetical protein n=1 Tax=Streptacidiphilus sp. MAP12-16 TaxID=3156300 RepID=UPI00351197B5
MASVVGLLEERELAARGRVEVLREEADRMLAELAGGDGVAGVADRAAARR